jgi:hypothetical protein
MRDTVRPASKPAPPGRGAPVTVVVEPAEGEPVVVGVVEVEAVEAGAVREDSEEVIGCPSL